MEPSRPRRSPHLLLLLPLALTALAYLGALHGQFELDDRRTVVENPRVRDLGWLGPGAAFAALRGERVVTDLSLALDHRRGGLDPFAYHVTSLLLHLAAVALAYLFTLRTLERAGSPSPRAIALVVGALLALHPIQTEAVAYVTQRSELLASLGYLAALLLFSRAEERGATPAGAGAWLAAALAFAIGLGAKPVVASLPVVFVLYGHVFLGDAGRGPWRAAGRRLLLVLPFALLGLAQGAGVLRSVQGSPDAGFDVPGLPWHRYFLTQWRVLLAYLGLLFWPARQNVDHDVPVASGLDLVTVLSGIALLAMVALALFLALRPATRWRDEGTSAAARVGGFGVLWFFALLAPTSSVVPLADAMVEHRLYLASWGIFLAAVAAAHALLARLVPDPRRAARVGGLAAAAVALALGIATSARARLWATGIALWTDAAAKSPRRARAQVNLGHALFQLGDDAGALRTYAIAETLLADGTVPPGELDAQIGSALVHAGRIAEALPRLERAVAAFPEDADVQNDLAICYLVAGRLGDAGAAVERALLLRPDHPAAHLTRGEILLEQGAPGRAVPWLDRAVSLDAASLRARYDLARALEQLGDARACAAWRAYAGLDGDPFRRSAAEARLAAMGCR